MAEQHRATALQWQNVTHYASSINKPSALHGSASAILELAGRLAVAEQRIEALEAAASAPADHFADANKMVATDAELERVFYESEGTAAADGFRALYNLGRQHGAAQAANPTPEQPPAAPAPAGGLVERVAWKVALFASQARVVGDAKACSASAILAVAEWLEEGAGKHGRWATPANDLREEVQRHG